MRQQMAKLIPLVALAVMAATVPYPAGLNAQELDPAAAAAKLVDPTQRDGAVRDLTAMGDKALPALKKLLMSKRSSEYLRREILKLLPQFGSKGIAIIKGAVKESALELEAVKQLARVEPDKAIESAMFDLLTASLNPKVRLLALDWLAEHGNAGRFNELLYNLLSDPSAKIRLRAGSLIADRRGLESLPRLMGMLRKAELARSNSNRGLRLAILETLGILGRKGQTEARRVVPTLLQALGEEDERQLAIDMLVELGSPAVSSLLMILKAGDTSRAAAAMDALLSIGQKAAPEVVSLLQARHPKMKKMARQFLCFYQDPAVFPLLQELYRRAKPRDRAMILKIVSLYDAAEPFEFIVRATSDEDSLVRRRAVRLLADTGRKAAVPVLLTRAEEDPDLDIRLAAVQGLYAMGEMGAVPSFVRMLEYEKWQVRLEILKAMAHMGTPSDIKTVSEQLRHRKSELAGAASRALANTTYLTGQRSPDEWVSDVRAIVEAGDDHKGVDVTAKRIPVADEDLEVAVLGSGDKVVMVVTASVGLKTKYLPRYLGELASNYTVVVVPFGGCRTKADERPALSECLDKFSEKLAIVKQEVSSEPVILLAQSVAGFGAIDFAAKHPDDVSRVVLANPIFPRRYHVEMALKRTLEKLPARWQKELEFLEHNSGMFSPRASNAYKSKVELASQVRGEGRAMLVAAGHYGLGWFLNDVHFPYEDAGIESSLANLKAPVLLVFGKDDWVLAENRESFRKIGRITGNFVWTAMEGSVRFSMVEQPERFQAAVQRFIRQYRLEGRVLGMGGGAPSALLTYGEVGEFAAAKAAVEVAGPASPRPEGQLVEPSRLTTFLSNRTPETIVSHEPFRPEKIEVEVVEVVAPEPPVVPVEVPVGDEPSGSEVAGVEAGTGPAGERPTGTTTSGGGPGPAIGATGMPGTTVTAAPSERSAVWDYVGWGLVGVGVLGMAGGAFMHWQTAAQLDQANLLDLGDYSTQEAYNEDFDAMYNQAGANLNFAYIGYGAGALLALVGVDLLLGWPISVGESAPQTRVSFLPVVLPEGGAFVMELNL